MVNELLRTSFWSSLKGMRLNTTKGICGANVYRPFGPRLALLFTLTPT